jgi:hypothetical protein
MSWRQEGIPDAAIKETGRQFETGTNAPATRRMDDFEMWASTISRPRGAC